MKGFMKGFVAIAVLALVLLAGIGIAQVTKQQVADNSVVAASNEDERPLNGCRTQYDVLNVNMSTPYSGYLGGLKVKLVNVDNSSAYPLTEHPATYQIYNRQNQLISEITMQPGQIMHGWYGPNQDKRYYVATIQTAPGFTLNARWAEMLFTVCN